MVEAAGDFSARLPQFLVRALDKVPHRELCLKSNIGHMTNKFVHFPAGGGFMLEPLLESPIKEKVLLYLHTHGECYPREIARDLGLYVNAVQYHLLKMEKGGVLYSKLKGKVRLFGINPRYPFKRDLEALLEKALTFVKDEERARLYKPRLRPRRTGKPLS